MDADGFLAEAEGGVSRIFRGRVVAGWSFAGEGLWHPTHDDGAVMNGAPIGS